MYSTFYFTQRKLFALIFLLQFVTNECSHLFIYFCNKYSFCIKIHWFFFWFNFNLFSVCITLMYMFLTSVIRSLYENKILAVYCVTIGTCYPCYYILVHINILISIFSVLILISWFDTYSCNFCYYDKLQH